jgi:hypothetical protein
MVPKVTVDRRRLDGEKQACPVGVDSATSGRPPLRHPEAVLEAAAARVLVRIGRIVPAEEGRSPRRHAPVRAYPSP